MSAEAVVVPDQIRQSGADVGAAGATVMVDEPPWCFVALHKRGCSCGLNPPDSRRARAM